MICTGPPDPAYTEIDQFDTCELHAGQPLLFVCLDCDECRICDECCKFIHPSHSQQDLTAYNRTQMEILRDNRRKLTEVTEESKRKVDSLKKQIKSSRRKSEQAMKEATNTAELLWQEITREKDELFQNIDRYTSACAKQLAHQQEELQHRIKQYKLITDRIEDVAKTDNHNEIFKKVEGIKKHCSGALNLKPLCSLPVYKPVFRRNPNLLRDFEQIQIGVVVDTNGHSDNESEEEDDVYVVEEYPWIYEVKPMPVDSVNSSFDGSNETEFMHQDNSSAGSSYCQRSGAEVGNQTVAHNESCRVMPDSADNSSAGSSYAHFSETNLVDKNQSPEGVSDIKPGHLNISSSGSGDTSSFDLDPKRTEKATNEDKRLGPKEEQMHAQKSKFDAPSTGQYSFARRPVPLRDRPLSPRVPIPMKDEHKEVDQYESLLQKRTDSLPSMLRSTDAYCSLQGSISSLDRIEDGTKLPQKFKLYFNKSEIIPTENTMLSGKTLKRVFLPFTFTGFTTVSRENDTLLAFVTTGKDVILLRKNGVEFSRITELANPFDVGSNGSFPYTIYITDSGARPGEGSVRVYSCAGGYLDTFAGGLQAPRGIDLSPEGHVYVCDQVDKCVYGFSPKGCKTLRMNICGNGFPKYVSWLNNKRLAVTDNARENLVIIDTVEQIGEWVKTKVGDLLCRGMCSEDVEQDMLFVVHPEGNILHVKRGRQHEVIELGESEGAPPLVPMRDELGNVFVF